MTATMESEEKMENIQEVAAGPVVDKAIRCPYCGFTIDGPGELGWNVDFNAGVAMFFHNKSGCMAVINCQILALKMPQQQQGNVIEIPKVRLG